MAGGIISPFERALPNAVNDIDRIESQISVDATGLSAADQVIDNPSDSLVKGDLVSPTAEPMPPAAAGWPLKISRMPRLRRAIACRM
jgi:hypothetical protein